LDGNRVTCRDWFQLSLKEGLTVFRDQEFSADLMGSTSGRTVKRIEDVRLLRQVQFPEDAGPMAHPIRPDSYQEINNFYTVTVYEKGSEKNSHASYSVGREWFYERNAIIF
jgi:aminopeptidase N